MIDKVTEMFKPATESTLEYVRDAMDRTTKLAQTQFEVVTNLYDETQKDYSDLLTSSAPMALVRDMPRILGSTTRSSAKASVTLLKNAIAYQAEILQLMQNRVPSLHHQWMQRFIESARASAESVDAFMDGAAANESTAQAPRTRKAA
ncbi:MAG: hypothetical protein IPI44_21305 [Sulfuritalea sp.]|nr:hypothetical protein [Sulfuritalea sp.]